MAADPNFTAYLKFMEPYQNLIQEGFWLGIIAIVIGSILTIVMRKYSTQDNLGITVNEPKVYINFGSSNAGSIVILMGGLVTCVSLWVTKYSIPKVQFNQNGTWTTAQNESIPDIQKIAKLKEIGNAELMEVILSAINSETFKARGFLLPFSTQRQLADAGIEAYTVSNKQIDKKLHPASTSASDSSLFVLQSELFKENEDQLREEKARLLNAVQKAMKGEAKLKIESDLGQARPFSQPQPAIKMDMEDDGRR